MQATILKPQRGIDILENWCETLTLPKNDALSDQCMHLLADTQVVSVKVYLFFRVHLPLLFCSDCQESGDEPDNQGGSEHMDSCCLLCYLGELCQSVFILL